MRIISLTFFVVHGIVIGSNCLAVEVDGTRDVEYGDPFAVQQIQTGFGDNMSELDAAYAVITEGKLFLMLTGNLESNFNKLEVFVDSVNGGQNRIRASANPNNDNWATKFDGFTFDSGFSADYLFIVRHGFDGTKLDLDFAELGAQGQGSLMGSFDPVTLGRSGPFEASRGLKLGFNNTNSAGVGSAQGQPANADAAANVMTGVELEIPLQLIGSPKGEIKVCAMINGHGHDYLSNQFLGSMPKWTNNLGTDGQGGFVQDSSLQSIDLNDYAGDQFFVIPGPAAPLEITEVSLNIEEGKGSFTWSSSPGTFYTVESSFDLRVWEEVNDGVASQGKSTTYNYELPEEKIRSCFYRIVEQ